jgi:serine/threonine-protein kinase
MAVTDPLVGSVLDGRYRVEGPLAHGGMSTVYTGTDLRLERTVAIKVMAPALALDPAFVDRFTREARASARLSHINVVSVYDQGEDAGRVFLVMELVSGRTLRDLLHEQRRLAPDLAVSLLEPILAALSAAHRAGLVHRDVKPENVLLADDGVVKVADFGLARAVAQAAVTTATGMVLGTVAYVAPEQVSRGTTDPRTDVYSAGILLYEMLTGYAPYSGDNPISVAYRHVHDDVPPPSAIVPGLPDELDAITMRATRREPGARPADAGAFLAELYDVRTDLGLRRVPVPPRPTDPSAAEDPGDTGDDDTSDDTGRDDDTDRTTVLGATSPIGVDRPSPPAPTPTADMAPTVASAAARPAAAAVPPPPPTAPPPAARPAPRAGDEAPGDAMSADGADPDEPSTTDEQHRRRRRFLIGLLVILLIGALAAGAGWWFGSGRYTSVPKLTRLTISQAQNAARTSNVDLQIMPSRMHSESVPPGAVAWTHPSIGARVVRGTTVQARLSAGPERYTLPTSIVGGTKSAAVALLHTLPLATTYRPAYNETVPNDHVVSVTPTPGTAMRRDQQVVVVVSRGPKPFGVPKVTGMPADHALAVLHQANLKTTTTQKFSTSVDKGSVVSEQPSSGTVVRGDTVALVVSKGPDYVTVPKVTGLSVPDATQRLKEAGFAVEVKVYFGGALGLVAQQDPNADQLAVRGSTVQIVVV